MKSSYPAWNPVGHFLPGGSEAVSLSLPSLACERRKAMSGSEGRLAGQAMPISDWRQHQGQASGSDSQILFPPPTQTHDPCRLPLQGPEESQTRAGRRGICSRSHQDSCAKVLLEFPESPPSFLVDKAPPRGPTLLFGSALPGALSARKGRAASFSCAI